MIKHSHPDFLANKVDIKVQIKLILEKHSSALKIKLIITFHTKINDRISLNSDDNSSRFRIKNRNKPERIVAHINAAAKCEYLVS